MLHIINHQLLGDSLMATPALKKLTELGVDYSVYFLDEPIMEIYRNCYWMKNKHWGTMPEPKEGDRVVKLESGMALNHALSTGQHYAYGFAAQLGVSIDSPVPDIGFEGWENKEIGFTLDPILIFPESTSCSSKSGKKANKMLPWETWVEFQDKIGQKCVFITPKMIENAPKELKILSDFSIENVAQMLKKASKVITVDNGIGHLSSAVGANCYLIGGCVPIPWIWAGDMAKTLNCYGNPELVRANNIIDLIR